MGSAPQRGTTQNFWVLLFCHDRLYSIWGAKMSRFTRFFVKYRHLCNFLAKCRDLRTFSSVPPKQSKLLSVPPLSFYQPWGLANSGNARIKTFIFYWFLHLKQTFAVRRSVARQLVKMLWNPGWESWSPVQSTLEKSPCTTESPVEFGTPSRSKQEEEKEKVIGEKTFFVCFLFLAAASVAKMYQRYKTKTQAW